MPRCLHPVNVQRIMVGYRLKDFALRTQFGFGCLFNLVMHAVPNCHPRVQVCLSLLTALHVRTGSLETKCQKELAAASVVPWREEGLVSRLLLWCLPVALPKV